MGGRCLSDHGIRRILAVECRNTLHFDSRKTELGKGQERAISGDSTCRGSECRRSALHRPTCFQHFQVVGVSSCSMKAGILLALLCSVVCVDLACAQGGGSGAGGGGTLLAAVKKPSPPKARPFRLLWADEFNGSKLDSTKWKVVTGDGSDIFGEPGWGTNELVRPAWVGKGHKLLHHSLQILFTACKWMTHWM